MSCPFAGDGSLSIEDFAAPPKRAAAQSHLRTFTDGDKCPAREVIENAEAKGPSTGWCDGWLTFEHGFLEPDGAGTSMQALRRTAGAAWIEKSAQLPSLVAHAAIQLRLADMPIVAGDAATIPDAALNAADVVLSTLAAAFSWEWRKG